MDLGMQFMNTNKKYMEKYKKLDFKITSDSLDNIINISENMEGKTFHYHTHILYDIRTSLGESMITYFEIGSFAGGSASLISSHKYPTKCFSLDIGYPIPQEIVERNVTKFKNPNSFFTYFKGNSQDPELIEYVKKNIKDIDILFIDGDHTRKAVLSDFYNYSELVKEGGYIVFDDYLDFEFSPEVKGAVDEIVEKIKGDNYKIIGPIKYDILSKFTSMDHNSLFIIKKCNRI